MLPVATCAPVDGKIASFKYWSKTQQTETGTLPPEVLGTDTITNGDILYPVFEFDTEIQNITLTVILLPGQTLLSGSTELTCTYKEGASTNKKFKELNKPDIYQANKTFSGYYKNYNYEKGEFSDKWDDNADVTQNDSIYVKMDDVVTDCVVNFSYDSTLYPEAKGCKWVGNRKVTVEKDAKLSSIAVPNVYYNADEDPNPAIGFKTDWYFVGWYLSTDTAVEKTLLSPDYKFTSSCTLYPKFTKKTNVVFQTYIPETTPETDDYVGKYVPTASWSDVVKPTNISGLTGKLFTGWKATMTDGSQQQLADFMKIEQIKQITATDPTTTTIIPMAEAAASCHEFIFDTAAHIKGTVSDTHTIEYDGNQDVGILIDSTREIVVDNELNKPLVPKTKDDGTGKAVIVEANKGYTFENEWEISTDQTNWKDIKDETIPSGTSSQKVYYLRPVIIKNATVEFDPGTDGKLATGSINSIDVSPGTTFDSMYKPEVVATTAGKTFSHWIDANGNKVLPSRTFTDTDNVNKLTAVYIDDKVSFTINYHVSKDDLNNPTFPAEKLGDDNTFKVSIVDSPDKTHKFSEFAERLPVMPCHECVGWSLVETGETRPKIDPNTEVPSGGDGLDVYALFKETGDYHEITIAPGTDYTVEGDSTLYAIEGPTPINSLTNQFEIKEGTVTKFHSNVWKVGHKLTGWLQSDGKTPLPSRIEKDYLNIIPVFKEADPILVSFKTSTDYTLSTTTQAEIPVHDKLINYINKTGWAPTATKSRATFNNWAIYNGDDKDPTPITDDYRVTGPITLVPQFMDESIFEGSSDPYYYDQDKQMWAAIKKFYDPEEQYKHDLMTVHYQDGTEGYVSKTTFNYEVKFGSQMTKIPDYFMYGCINWNNGGQPLYFPKKTATTSGLTEIGKNVMYGCTSFNQPVDILAAINDQGVQFKVGQNFMRGCSSFNSDISIRFVPQEGGKGQTEGQIAFSDGFMFECNSFASKLYLTGWTGFGYMTWVGECEWGVTDDSYFYSCLAGTDKNAPAFTIIAENNDCVTKLTSMFPKMNGPEAGHLYRWTYRKQPTIKVKE